MRIGIFFGGPSREREISFAGGRTVYDNLNRSLFEPVPIFVDSFCNFILLEWHNIYKGSIRDFFPPVEVLPESPYNYQIYAESLGAPDPAKQDKIISRIGKKIPPSELKKYIDFAFLALHGPYGEDGRIQSELEKLGIPYSGSGILPSSIAIDKAAQKEIITKAGFRVPRNYVINRESWLGEADKKEIYQKSKKITGIPCVVKPANQGSSVGTSIPNEDDFDGFCQAVDKSFFIYHLTAGEWGGLAKVPRAEFIRSLTDIKESIGIPVRINEKVIYHPDQLLVHIKNHFHHSTGTLLIEATDTESRVVIEEFIDGKEFSSITIQDENRKAISLPPTEIIKGKEIFDYRSKYLAGMTRKVTPIDLPDKQVEAIRKECERLYHVIGFNVYARIDGFIKKDGSIYLNDPNTTSGMLPSSFFFHQAAEIGLNPSQFLTYIIRTSMAERMSTNDIYKQYQKMLHVLDEKINKLKQEEAEKIQVSVLMGGYTTERHISIESGRNIYEKLASSVKYEPVPVFLTGSGQEHRLYQLPISLLLKDNADDIKEKAEKYIERKVLTDIKTTCGTITSKYAYAAQIFKPKKVTYNDLQQITDIVCIALHGRPGEDGTVQKELEKHDIPYNGSRVESSLVMIDKFRTSELLKAKGSFTFPKIIVSKNEWAGDTEKAINGVEKAFKYPFIAKPVDEGCSAAVKKINDREQLKAYAQLIYREDEAIPDNLVKALDLKPKEEIPMKTEFLVEELAAKGDAKKLIEITGGMLTHYDEKGNVIYEIFEPSEAIAGKEILSLEEKFLAGEGQNITPARFSSDAKENEAIGNKVKTAFKETAGVLNIEGYARIDAFVRIYDNGRVEVIILEVNSLPGMTPATCIFHQAAINGYKPYNFIDKILEFGFKRKKLFSRVEQ